MIGQYVVAVVVVGVDAEDVPSSMVEVLVESFGLDGRWKRRRRPATTIDGVKYDQIIGSRKFITVRQDHASYTPRFYEEKLRLLTCLFPEEFLRGPTPNVRRCLSR